MASSTQVSNDSFDSNQGVQDHVEPSCPVGEPDNKIKCEDFVEEFVGEDLGLEVRPTVINVPSRFVKPFMVGIYREVVIRKFQTSLETSQVDIYYHTPQPHPKIRSLRDVQKYLKKYPEMDLKLENFSFSRVPLGIKNSQYELIRRVRPNRRAESQSDRSEVVELN